MMTGWYVAGLLAFGWVLTLLAWAWRELDLRQHYYMPRVKIVRAKPRYDPDPEIWE